MKKTGESGRVKFWRPVTVRTILKNPVYKGEMLVGRKEVITDESRRERGLKNSFYLRDRPEDECIPIPVPALVSPDTWQTVQNRLADNKARMSGRKSRRFVLSGLWRCPVCRNRGSVAHRQGKGHAYYCKTKAVCHPYSYSGKSADKAVFDTLMSLMQRPELMETAIHSYISKGSKSDAANTRAVLLKELSSLQEREQATVKAQIAGIQAGADASMYESAFGEIAKRRRELHQRLAIIEGQEEAITCDPRDTATLFATIIADIETAGRAT